MALFPAGSVKLKFCNFPRVLGNSPSISYYPGHTALLGCNVIAGLGCSPFARHYLGNHFCFLFLRVLRCFNSPGISSATYVFSYRCRKIITAGFPIRLPPDQRMLAPPRGLSQLATTFIDFQCQGIHLACFSPFPHGTSALSVIEEYLGLEGGPP